MLAQATIAAVFSARTTSAARPPNEMSRFRNWPTRRANRAISVSRTIASRRPSASKPGTPKQLPKRSRSRGAATLKTHQQLIRKRLLLGSLAPAALIGLLVSIFFVVNASRTLDEPSRPGPFDRRLPRPQRVRVHRGNRDSLMVLLQATLAASGGAARRCSTSPPPLAISGPLTLPSLDQLRPLHRRRRRPPDRPGDGSTSRRSSDRRVDPQLDAPAARARLPEVIGWVYVERLDLAPLAQRKKDLLLTDAGLLLALSPLPPGSPTGSPLRSTNPSWRSPAPSIRWPRATPQHASTKARRRTW